MGTGREQDPSYDPLHNADLGGKPIDELDPEKRSRTTWQSDEVGASWTEASVRAYLARVNRDIEAMAQQWDKQRGPRIESKRALADTKYRWSKFLYEVPYSTAKDMFGDAPYGWYNFLLAYSPKWPMAPFSFDYVVKVARMFHEKALAWHREIKASVAAGPVKSPYKGTESFVFPAMHNEYFWGSVAEPDPEAAMRGALSGSVSGKPNVPPIPTIGQIRKRLAIHVARMAASPDSVSGLTDVQDVRARLDALAGGVNQLERDIITWISSGSGDPTSEFILVWNEFKLKETTGTLGKLESMWPLRGVQETPPVGWLWFDQWMRENGAMLAATQPNEARAWIYKYNVRLAELWQMFKNIGGNPTGPRPDPQSPAKPSGGGIVETISSGMGKFFWIALLVGAGYLISSIGSLRHGGTR